MAKLPSVVSSLAPDLRAFINRVREAIDGKDGSRLVSVDELVRTGIASTGPGGTLAPPNTGVNAPVRTPPAATGLTATGGVYSVFVEWEDPRYFGHAYTEVWGADTDNVGDAVSLGMSPGVNFTDPLSPGTVRYYWIRFVNIKGVIGAYNAIAGTRGETVPEVGHLLEVLNNSITESELFSDLGARIDQIDVGPDALVPRVSSLRGKFTVKIDNNGYVSGFGLASTENNATPFSDFAIRADRFYVASPSGPGITPMIPFKVVTTPQVINGTNVPVGVYIDGAYIQGGSITGSAIINGTITGTKLIDVSADKITGAALLSTSYIESAGYIAGSQGWKIGGNGVAEFAAASIRGQLVASQINANGLSIKDVNGNVILNAGTGDFTGSLNGTATSTVVSNASTALSTANSASSAASTAQSTANTAQSTADSAASAASTAQTTANSAVSGLATKIGTDTRSVLSGGGGIAIGSLNWDTTGNRTSGYGIGITSAGIAAFKSNGTATFVLNGGTGDASFGGALSAATGTFTGALVAATGTFSGLLSAAQIAVGTASGTTTFYDPQQPSIPLSSIATGFLAYSGDTGTPQYVSATCTDSKSGTPYDCSYYTYAGVPVSSAELEFTTNTTSVPVARRVRVGTMKFIINASATAEHYFSIWYRYKQPNGTYQAWLPIAMAIEPQGGYGATSISGLATLGMSLGWSVQFGFSATNESGTYWRTDSRELRNATITVTGTNF